MDNLDTLDMLGRELGTGRLPIPCLYTILQRRMIPEISRLSILLPDVSPAASAISG